jgi:hypothetical protein
MTLLEFWEKELYIYNASLDKLKQELNASKF